MILKTENHRFNRKSLKLLEQSKWILESFHQDGFSVTLRTLYYQLLGKNLIRNSRNDYQNLSNLITSARRSGQLDWSYITDETRRLDVLPHFESIGDILAAAAESYKIDLWRTQAHRVEVWCEKTAMAGVLLPTCRQYDVPFLSVRGQTSATAIHDAGLRIDKNHRAGQTTIILYFGDHDSTGMGIPESIKNSLHFVNRMFGLERIALNIDQVHKHKLPANIANKKDKNFKKYQKLYGNETWEIDALDPHVTIALLKSRLINF